ncbi:MAG: c-type cytochrome [Solirubrobacteraceae bacterium]
MHRSTRVLITFLAAIVIVSLAAACGTEKIGVPKSDPNYASDLAGAQLFQQRCGGCHTLSYAGTRGSAANIRTAEAINGPNFNINCERPVARVLYAIENGGFSGAYMPANVVVGEQARQVAQFVAGFSGRKAPLIPGQPTCEQRALGTLPAPLDPLATK